MSRLSELHETLSEIAPIHGVDINKKISFKSTATSQQKTDAQAIADAWDFTEKIPKALNNIITEIQGLSVSDRTKLMTAIAADFLRQHPRFAEKLGITISGDE